MNSNIVKETIEEITKQGYEAMTLNEKQVAKIIGISQSTLSNWRKEGKGPAYMKMTEGKGRVIYTKRNVAHFLLEQNIKVA